MASLKQLSYHEGIFNFNKGFFTATSCYSFPLWSLWWRKARWYFLFVNFIFVVLCRSSSLGRPFQLQRCADELCGAMVSRPPMQVRKKTGQKLMCKKQCSLDPLPIPVEGHTMDWVDFNIQFETNSISIQQLNFIEQSIHRSTTLWSHAEASMGLGQLHPVFSSRTEHGSLWRIQSIQGEYLKHLTFY